MMRKRRILISESMISAFMPALPWMKLIRVMTIINFIQGSAGMRAEIILSLINIILFLVFTGKLDNIINNIKNRSNRNRFR